MPNLHTNHVVPPTKVDQKVQKQTQSRKIVPLSLSESGSYYAHHAGHLDIYLYNFFHINFLSTNWILLREKTYKSIPLYTRDVSFQ